VSDGTDEAQVAGTDETDPEFRALLEKLSSQNNFDFREYKEPSLARRIRNRMSQAHINSYAVYARYLDESRDERVALFNAILINVTDFFRDPDSWATLEEEVFPRMLAEAAESRTLRVWCAGCSSGEEPYSVAMLLAERLGYNAGSYSVKIYGTDIDEDALASARHALYRVDQMKNIPDRLIDRHFTRDGQFYRVRRDIRRWCIFGSHNLTQAPPLSHIDLLICRNVLIYFTSELQERIVSRFHYAVREEGFLFLGRSESLLARSKLFTPVHLKWRIFQRMAGGAPQVAAVLPEHLAGQTEHAPPRPEFPSPAARIQRALEALPAGVMVIDMSDIILSWNPAAEVLFDVPTADALGRKFRDLDVSYRVEGLRGRIEDVKVRHASSRMEDATFPRRNGDVVHADITIAPLFEAHRLIGVLVYASEATDHARLKAQMTRVAEQHATAIEELQSTNEELETTNEELQSTNEELETTNEELQSTNEELETTVEELQAANTELGALNMELESRGAELKQLNAYHHSMLNSMEQSIFVTDRAMVVTTWNHGAERMWGLPSEQVIGRDVFSVPLGDASIMRRAAEEVLGRGTPVEIPDAPYTLPGGETRRAILRLAALRDTLGEISGVIGMAWPEEAAATDIRRR
jgi:two-component system, chemotaxis family, CheB/CheR fusion protein